MARGGSPIRAARNGTIAHEPAALPRGLPNGTIGPMADHRIRLGDDDIALIVSALRARAAMTTGLRRHRLERLATRLAEGARGNPKLTLGAEEQTHEEDIDDAE